MKTQLTIVRAGSACPLFAKLAAFGLAMALTFSCSGDNGGGNGGGGNELSSPSMGTDNSSSSDNGGGSGLIGTSGTFIDVRDNKPYKWVKIGEQYWMAENLNYEVEGGSCYKSVDYPDEVANCEKYGRLYNWATAMEACPIGWHLPNDEEWVELFLYVDPENGEGYSYGQMVGKYLKAIVGWETYAFSVNIGEYVLSSKINTDDYSFSALPGGFGRLRLDGTPTYYGEAGRHGYWWSSSEYTSLKAHYRRMRGDYDVATKFNTEKSELLSVRCIKGDISSSSSGGSSSSSAGAINSSSSSVLSSSGSSSSQNDQSSSSGSSSSSDNNIQGGCPDAVTGNNTVTCGGKTYRTVKIGEQTWMAENLNYTVKGSRCYGEGGTLSDSKIQTNCDKYGRLYDWATAMALPSSCNTSTCAGQVNPKHRGICPSGWHIPSDADWDALITAAGGIIQTAGKYLKATNGWNDYNGESGNGTDEFGFAALPGGGYSNGDFSNVGNNGYWWSASESGAYGAYGRSMYYLNEFVAWFSGNKGDYLFSIRCLKDD
ncbi:MAG: hypothetical protein LBC64_06085 [Fibromonadaceae bacterium]|jgi:uncharacterized protein (TIGR02145 family)|nr:hypothetical protein [Fibromonadaceae bacterium]